MGEVVYCFEYLTGPLPFVEPRYRVTRRRTGRWPWRQWEYLAECEHSTMTMSAEAYAWFKAQFRTQIDEEFDV